MSTAASAGGAASEPPPPPPAPPSPPALPRCENCGAPVAQKFCGACGQKLEPPVHSLWQFSQHAAEDLTHADSRLWRTLWALLFRPGYLTLEFLRGRRAHYLPPLRLYLVLSVVFFLYASATHDRLGVLQLEAPAKGAPGATVSAPASDNGPLSARAGESLEARVQRVCGNFDYNGPLQARVSAIYQRVCPRVVADGGRSIDEAFLHNMPRAMFLFLPALAGVMMLMYWRPRHYYVEHLLLLVHNHAFVFLAVLITWLLVLVLPFAEHALRSALFFYIVWYAFRSLRVVYGQGRLLTGVKCLVLALFYLFGGALMIGLDVLYSALTL